MKMHGITNPKIKLKKPVTHCTEGWVGPRAVEPMTMIKNVGKMSTTHIGIM